MDVGNSNISRGWSGRIATPLLAFTVVGGMATMIGRGRSKKTNRKQAADLVRTLNDPKVRSAILAAQRALDEARGQISARDGRRMQEQLSKRTVSAVDTTLSTMSPTMKDAGERARELAERIRAEGQARLPEINQRLREDVAPKARSLAQDAVSEAEEILSDARQRATELSKNARRDYGPEVSNKASAMASLIAAGSTAGVQMLRDRASDMASQSKGKTSRKVTKRAKKRASSALNSAGSHAKYVATESMMVGIWASLLGATIYFALLTRDQRERVKGFFSNLFTQAQDVMSDFQSGSEEYQSSSR
jgi:ElaB/YqjD/DUF883 family membrane-anchored ribosome-binding protein